MPSVAVLAPVVLPLIAAGVIAVFGLFGLNLGRAGAAAGAWAAAAALFAVWLPVRSSVELTLGPLGYGSSFDMRIDATAFAFGLMVALPAAVLLTLQPRTWQEAALSALGVAASLAAVEAGSVVLTAIAGGTAATLALVLLDTEDPRAPRPSWGLLLGGWLALSWAGVLLQVRGGTAVYSAVPVATVTSAVFSLLAVAALFASCLFPWRSWPAQLWSRPSLRAAPIAIGTLFPLGFYVLVRAYELGNGRYPQPVFNVLVAVAGIATALAAGLRAQAAETRREFLGEVIPGLGGFALMAIALGTPLGLVAGLVMLATASAFVAGLALLPDRAGVASLVAIAAAVGLPPSLAFGARVVGIEATFEAGDFLGLIGLAAAATWAVWMVGGARAIGLAAGRGRSASETNPRVALVIAAATLAAGPALALVQFAYGNPVALEVMPAAAGIVAGGLTSVATVSSDLPVVTLFVPLLGLLLLVYAAGGVASIRTQARPALFKLPAAGVVQSARAAVRAATVPEQYRSILSLRELETAASAGKPLLWLGALVALAFAVTR
jgi:formate hydrogenlyase subunit 3/multisubunit Na+/H+ antiporter MnhD subunit